MERFSSIDGGITQLVRADMTRKIGMEVFKA